MPCNPSPSQSQASRENGMRSRGAVSADGRKRSAQRGTKSGLRARTHALGHESADRAERGDHWHGFYAPRSPSALHMTNQCARATLLSDRVDDYQHAEFTKQVREEKEKWHRKQKRRLRYLAGQIRKKPPCEIVKKLMAFGEGVAFLAESFQAMIHEINERGQLSPEAVECLRMMFGMPLDEEENRRNRLAYWITLNTLGCTPEESAAEAIRGDVVRVYVQRIADQAVANWVGTTGFDAAGTKGIYYGRVFPQCEPAVTDSGIADIGVRVPGCIENSSEPGGGGAGPSEEFGSAERHDGNVSGQPDAEQQSDRRMCSTEPPTERPDIRRPATGPTG